MESESGQSDVTSIDPTRRIVKYLSKCLIELIKHAESIQYKHNKLVNYDVSSTVNYGSDNEIDITEHNIKTEIKKEGPIFKQIERINQCIVELLTICSQQNIRIDYDTTKPHVDIYDGFDDPQRILVMNHLTLHVLSMVENIYLSVKLFKNKNMDNGQHIKKTFSQIYKDIKTLPMRPDIIDNMDSSFKSLTHKSEYNDSYNYLVEKLGVLCKYICKFNKLYAKYCGYNDFLTMEDSTDDDNSPRKKVKNKTREKTYIKPENDNINMGKEPEATFKIPESIENIIPNMENNTAEKQLDETQKKKKDTINTNAENENNNVNCENLTQRDLLLNELLNDTIKKVNMNADTEKKRKKKKKSKNDPEHKTNDNTSQIKLNNSTDISNQKENANVENNLNECKNDRIDTSKKKRKNIKNKNSDNTTSTNKKVDENKEKEKLENTKKRRMSSENTQQLKKHKLDKHLSNTETNATLNNAEEEKNQKNNYDDLNEDELNFLASHFLSLEHNELDASHQSNISLETENNVDATDKDTISADVLAAISSGNIEIDYDNKDYEDFTKIIRENNLNEHERFLYIQDLIEAANAKIAISEEKKEKISNLNILVDWEVCPAHLLCSNLSAGPNEEEKSILEKLGVTSGQFTRKEDEIIRKNWKTFCQKHDLDDDPSPFMVMVVDNKKILTTTERKKFLQFIGQGLPHKTLHSIFRRFKCLFKPKVKYGRFSPEEDELILTYLSKIKREENKQKYVRLAPLIKRDRWQIERRHRALKEAASQSSTKHIKWTLQLKETFLKHLLEETQSKSINDLRDKYIDIDMFNLIGKLMDVSGRKLRIHWIFRLHTELFATEPLNTDLLKIKLIKKFHELDYEDWKTIDWKLVKSMFDGLTKSYLWITLKNTVRDYVPSDKQKDLRACIDHLYSNYLPILEAKSKEGKDRILPRLRFENGTLQQYK